MASGKANSPLSLAKLQSRAPTVAAGSAQDTEIAIRIGLEEIRVALPFGPAGAERIIVPKPGRFNG